MGSFNTLKENSGSLPEKGDVLPSGMRRGRENGVTVWMVGWSLTHRDPKSAGVPEGTRGSPPVPPAPALPRSNSAVVARGRRRRS